MAINKLYS